MTPLHRLTLVAALVPLAGCVVAPYPYTTATPPPTVTKTPPSFDRSWDAALGAAADAGVQVTRADRDNGRITGSKAGAAVTIELRRLPDSTLEVSFSAPDSKEVNPPLKDRWLDAYQRRMGR